MISNFLTKKTDFNDPEYQKWIKRIPIYIFTLLWYFIFVSLIVTNLLFPLIRSNFNTISYEDSATYILNYTANDTDSIGFVDSNTFNGLNIDADQISTFDTITDKTILLHVGNYYYNDNSLGIFISVKSPHLSTIFENGSTNVNFINEVLGPNNSNIKWSNGKDLKVYYNFEDFNIESPIDLDSFSSIRVEKTIYVSLYNFLIYVLYAVPLLFFFMPKLKDDWHTLKKDHKENPIGNRIINNLALLIVAPAALNLVAIGLKVLLNLPLVSSNQAAINNMLSSNGKYLMVLSAVLIGPFVEEVIYRKTIFSLIKNDTIAIIISSLLFGLVHVTSEPNFLLLAINFISYAGAGVILGYIYKKNNHNLLLLYILHALSNLISVLGSL